MPSFHEVQFPTDIGIGAKGGPAFSTSIIAAGSGYEQRNINWSQARGRWDVGLTRATKVLNRQLLTFFRNRMGKAYGFRFRDYSDYQVTGQPIGTGDGNDTTFQLVQTYTSGDYQFTRTITKPVTASVKNADGNAVANTVHVYLDDVEQMSGWTCDHATGIITFDSAPALNVVVTADFDFDVPVRFDIDHMDDLTAETPEVFIWPSIPIVEIRI